MPEDRYQVTFQSRLGREEWLQPYTDLRLEELARSGEGGAGMAEVVGPTYQFQLHLMIAEKAMIARKP